MARKRPDLSPQDYEEIREIAKAEALRIVTEGSRLGASPFLLSPVTRPFAAPLARGIPATANALLKSGALDGFIDAKINELAAQRGIKIASPEQKSRQELVFDLAEAGIDILTDPEVVSAANEIVDASGGQRFSAGIRRQFSRANSVFGQLMPDEPVKRTRKKTKNDKNMSKALEEANKRLRKINGGLRKGKTQSDVMRLAQRLAKKMR